MANDKINYSEKIENLLKELPEFIADFIYSNGNIGNSATKFEYCKDIKDFFTYIINFVPEHCDKQTNQLTIKDVENIEILTINRYFSLLEGNQVEGLKKTTIKRRRASLSSMYGFFVRNEKMKRNPVLATNPIKIPEKELIYLTNEEQSKLLDVVRYGTNLSEKTAKVHNLYAERDSAMFLLLLDTGMRVSEMLDTDICDYNLTNCSVIVRRKGGDIQEIYYSDECSEYLEQYFLSQKTRYMLDDVSLPAFTTTTGNRLGVRAVEMLVKKYASAALPDKAKILSPHKLRSSFAMSFYEASDNNILLLQKKLNHKNIATTNIYAKASEKDMKESRGILQGRR